MGRARDGRAGRPLLGAAAALLLLCSPPLRAQQVDSPSGSDPAAPPPTSQSEESDTKANPPAPPPSWIGDIGTRSQLTGDWCGARSNLADHGLTFFADITQYYQGPAVGGLARQFLYGGRADYLIDLDSQKMGLWKGGHLDLRGETRLGLDVNAIDGVAAPANYAMALPRSNRDITALTGVQFTQDLSERISVLFGKLNLLDGTPAGYARGARLNSFWNAAMQNNLSRAFLLPSTLGAGFVVRDEAEPVVSFYLLDTHYVPTTSGLPSLFSNGVLLYGEYRLRTNWFDLPGHSTFGILYSNASRTILDLNPSLQFQALQSGEAVQTKHLAWSITYRFDQVVYADSQNPKRTWTLYGDAGLTDGNPNPVRWFANLSLVGSSPISGRENDTIGIGYYHLGVSTLPVVKSLGFGAEDGVELFYNAAVTPWFHITPDVQVLNPAQRKNPTTLLVGVRARLSF